MFAFDTDTLWWLMFGTVFSAWLAFVIGGGRARK
jgi:hypothetical protein